MEHDAMRQGTRSWRQAVKHVIALLNDLDPYGLEPGKPGGAPEDEYDLEAAPIALRLLRDGRLDVEHVDAIWLKWFGERLSAVIGPGLMSQLIANLNGLVQPRASSAETR
jgi:hypothetical protein